MPFVKIKKCLNCGISHEWFFEGMTLKELREIKKVTGMRAKEFANAGDEGDPDAIAALIYVLHGRNKIVVSFDEVDLDFNDFEMEPTEEERAAIEKLEKEMEEAAENAQIPKENQIKSGRKSAAGSSRK